MNIEKAFDSLDHNFLVSTPEKYGFDKYFISWVKILLRNQESFFLNGGTTIMYFLLGRDACQVDPISFLKDLQSLTIATFTLHMHMLMIQSFSYRMLSL